MLIAARGGPLPRWAQPQKAGLNCESLLKRPKAVPEDAWLEAESWNLTIDPGIVRKGGEAGTALRTRTKPRGGGEPTVYMSQCLQGCWGCDEVERRQLVLAPQSKGKGVWPFPAQEAWRPPTVPPQTATLQPGPGWLGRGAVPWPGADWDGSQIRIP